MAITKPIRDALRASFYPMVFERGFELDKRYQPQMVEFRRFTEDKVHIFSSRWDKYQRAKFVIDFSDAPRDGIEWCGQFMRAEVMSPVHCGHYRRLGYRGGKLGFRWFNQRRPLLDQLTSFKRNFTPQEIADQVIERYPEMEAWWRDRTIGPHVSAY